MNFVVKFSIVNNTTLTSYLKYSVSTKSLRCFKELTRKQIEIVKCGLRQIIVKLWKFFHR
jgi:hypothetical protein